MTLTVGFNKNTMWKWYFNFTSRSYLNYDMLYYHNNIPKTINSWKIAFCCYLFSHSISQKHVSRVFHLPALQLMATCWVIRRAWTSPESCLTPSWPLVLDLKPGSGQSQGLESPWYWNNWNIMLVMKWENYLWSSERNCVRSLIQTESLSFTLVDDVFVIKGTGYMFWI